jgi:hypothetical protein
MLNPIRPAAVAPTFAITIFVVFGVGQYQPLSAYLNASAPSNPEPVNAFLRSAGMRDPESVVTNDPYLHATDVPARTRFTQAYFYAPNPSSPTEMLANPMIGRRQFLVLNHEQLYGDFQSVIRLAPQSKDLVPLELNATESIYCIMPCAFEDILPDNISYANGMRLLAHRATEWQGHVSLYLYWTAVAPLKRSFRTIVRVLSFSGQILGQVDQIPQFSTFPTNRWLPNETVVDFFKVAVGAQCANRCQLTLTVYDEQSMQVVPSLESEASAPREIVTLHVESLTALNLK